MKSVIRSIVAATFAAIFISPVMFPSKASSSSNIVELSACMNAYYGIGMWTQRTGIGAGSDIGPALTQCLAGIRSSSSTGRGKIIIDPGVWLMTTPPSASVVAGNYFEGVGSQASIIVFNSASGVAFTFYAQNGYSGGGIRGISILLEANLGDTLSYGIFMGGTSQYQADQFEINDVYMSAVGGSSFWYNGLNADGTGRTTPQGLRVATINNLQIFNCRNVGFYGANLVQWTLTNVGVYTGKGTGNDVFITGAGPALTNSVNVTAIGLIVSGTLHTENSSNIWINGAKVR